MSAAVPPFDEWLQTALSLHQSGQIEEAKRIYEKILDREPGHSDAINLLGTIAIQSGDFQKAAALYGKSIAIDPTNVVAWSNAGYAFKNLGRWQEALEYYEQALELRSDVAGVHLQRGEVLCAMDRLDAALSSYQRAAQIDGADPEPHVQGGNVLVRLKRFVAALQSFDRAIALADDYAEAHLYRGGLLAILGRFNEAMAALNRAIALSPEIPQAYSDRGNVHKEMGQLEAALSDYGQAIALQDDFAGAHFNRALLLLLRADLDQGWKEYEWRLKIPGATAFGQDRNCSKPRWAGEHSLAGKTILLHGEQGLGDTLQFCRYVNEVAALGAKIILEVQQPLVALLVRLEGVSQVIAEGDALPEFDFHCSLSSLPLAFKTRLDSIPSPRRYLTADAAKVERWRAILGPTTRPRVGLVWRGNPAFRKSRRRNLPLVELLECLPSGPQYVSLQKERESEDERLLQTRIEVIQYCDQLHDFDETAALCECMDIVISVDTSVAHLSGALGKDTLVALPWMPDWRWMLDRDDTPWYATARLYRQQRRGDWSGVLARISGELVRRFERSNAPAESADIYVRSAHALRRLEQKSEALAECDRAIALRDDHQRAYLLRALLLDELGRPEDALADYDRLIDLAPDNPVFYFNRGTVLTNMQRFANAVTDYDRALTLKPDYAEAHCNRGVAFHGMGQYERALASYEQAIRHMPDYAEAYCNRGKTLAELKRYELSIASYERAVAIKPDYPEAYLGRGRALAAMARFEEALTSYDKAVDLKSGYAEAYLYRGIALTVLRRFEAALGNYEQAIAFKPDYPEAYSNRGLVLTELGRFDQALDSFDRAVALRPGYPDARFNRAMLHLLLGDFERGWTDYEWRRDVREHMRGFMAVDRGFEQPLWMGRESLAGRTILLYSEQGLGDTLQFCRYVERVAALGAAVLLEVQRPLVGLLTCVRGAQKVVAKGETLSLFDYQCPLLSLPLAFKTQLHTVPAVPRYLTSDPVKIAQWSGRLGPRMHPRIGLVWRGNPNHRNDLSRSIGLTALLEHLPVSGFQYVSLQKEMSESDRLALERFESTTLDISGELVDFSDTAAVCDCMDLVISVDTSVAHLSGALGRKTWILLPAVPDWRWLLSRKDSPWYPSVKLYRQTNRNEWDSVLGRVGDDLLRAFV